MALKLFDMSSTEQYLALDSHKSDLGFIVLRPALSGHAFLSECVAHDTILAALPTLHPFAAKPKLKLADGGFIINAEDSGDKGLSHDNRWSTGRAMRRNFGIGK